MPKAKFKRKGATIPIFENPLPKRIRSSSTQEEDKPALEPIATYSRNLLDLPEEVVCLILVRLDIASVSALEQTCKHIQAVLNNARVWRRIFSLKLEYEPELRQFMPTSFDPGDGDDGTENARYKELFGDLKKRTDYAWNNSHPATITRSNEVYGRVRESRVLCQIFTSGRYFVAVYGAPTNTKETHVIDVIDIFDRSTGEVVRTIDKVTGKPDIFRIVDELGFFLVSYPGQFNIQMVWLSRPDCEVLNLVKPGEAETGSVCDIVVREYVTIRGQLHRRIVMVAINTDPLENTHFHIGEIQFYSLSEAGELGNRPLISVSFNPVPIRDGGFYNQCIQKQGLTDFREDFSVVVVGGCEGSTVMGVVSISKERLIHKLPLKSPVIVEREGGCEGGFCTYSVVSLMIDQNNPEMCCILLSTGQLNVIHLPTGNTVFLRQIPFDGQLKLALHQADLMGKQRIGIKFRDFVDFYDLIIPYRASVIKFKHVRKLRITNVDADGRETFLDDNPSAELRRQFGELQKRVRALNHFTSGIQKKLDKGLRPGTITQGVLSMTKKVQLVTSKLDQAHGKAREIEAIVIASIAFDNRYCHALTLNKDLVTFDLCGAMVGFEEDNWRSTAARPTPGTSRSRRR